MWLLIYLCKNHDLCMVQKSVHYEYNLTYLARRVGIILPFIAGVNIVSENGLG